MASIVAYIELRQGSITDPSRFALAEARRVADAAGATVFALLTVGVLEQSEMDRLASEASAAGADRVLCASAEVLVGPPLDPTHGGVLAQVADHLRPLLILFPAGGSAAQLGPSLAIRMGAAFMSSASIELHKEDRTPDPPSQRVLFARWRAARDGHRTIDVGDLERSVVAGLAAGPVPAATGAPYAEVEMIPCPEPKFPLLAVTSSSAEPSAAVEACRCLIWSGAASPQARVALQQTLPSDTCLVSETEATLPSLVQAAPEDVFVLPSATLPLTAFMPKLTPAARIVLVAHDRSREGKIAASASSIDADSDLAAFATALSAAKEAR
jgi:hypothetical protein